MNRYRGRHCRHWLDSFLDGVASLDGWRLVVVMSVIIFAPLELAAVLGILIALLQRTPGLQWLR